MKGYDHAPSTPPVAVPVTVTPPVKRSVVTTTCEIDLEPMSPPPRVEIKTLQKPPDITTPTSENNDIMPHPSTNEGRPSPINEGHFTNEGRPPPINEGHSTNEGRPPPTNEGRPPPINEGRPPPTNEGRPPPINEGRSTNEGRPPPINEEREDLTPDDLIATIQSAVDELLLDYNKPSPEPNQKNREKNVNEVFTTELLQRNEVPK